MSEWISVKDKLPENYQEILIFIPAYPGASLGSFRDGIFDDHVIRGSHDNKVTHWMSMPAPPKESE